MAMYECTQCGDENSCFPQVIVGLNSKIDYGYDGTVESFRKRYDNLFERKFREFEIERANSLGMPVEEFNRWHIGDVWDKFSTWLVEDGQRNWFCSIECAIKWLAEREALDDYSI
jgi:hypothetical protein